MRYKVLLGSRPNTDYRDISAQGPNIPPRWESVANLAEARSVVLAFTRRHGLGGGNWIGGDVKDEKGRIVAHVSFNGRVWEGSGRDWTSRTKELLTWRKKGGLLAGTPAEHAETLGDILNEVPGIIDDAREAMRRGNCLLAGTLIDRGYVTLGRAQAEASWVDESAQRRVKAMLQRLKSVDEPFERTCVRREPLTEKQALVLHSSKAMASAPRSSSWMRTPRSL